MERKRLNLKITLSEAGRVALARVAAARGMTLSRAVESLAIEAARAIDERASPDGPTEP